MGAVISFLVIAIVVLLILSSCIRIVPQAQALVVERLGAYLETWSVGVHFKVPFIDRVAKRVILKEQVVDFAPQPVITKDNVTMKIDTVVFFQITDPKLFAYGVENPIMAIENLTATTLRNIIGDLELDQTLTSRETINTKMRAALDVATDPWGIKVNRVELKNIIPPAAIQDAMEKQMKAERERRESILRAEGEKKSTILVAEGKKESAILEAEAEKEAAILRAEAQKEKMKKLKVINMEFSEFVFLNRKGEPTKNSAYDSTLFKLCDKAGIDRFSMHVLRHTMATRCIEANMRPKTLQVILGHSNVGITMNLYVHVTEEEKVKEVEKIEKALKIV